MELRIYKNQKDVAKIYSCQSYDIMFGTLEDILDIVDSVTGLNGVSDAQATTSLIQILNANLSKVKMLLKDIFLGVTDEELRHIKVNELVPLIVELVYYTKQSIGGNDPKN